MNSSHLLPIICLMGPTASGKTDLAVELAQRLPLQIISADSALVYRDLNIGTAKPNREILAIASHRLIDICDPAQIYSAGNFRVDALREIADIHRHGHIPLLVGGTMLYFWVLQQGLANLPSADLALRAKLSARAAEEGWSALHQELITIDPEAAARIHSHDGQRIQRALEVYYLTGKPMSVWQQQHTTSHLPLRMINIVLAPSDRQLLLERIKRRTQQLFSNGFIQEVEQLRNRADIHADLPAMRTVGYRQVWEYLDGQYDLPTLQERVCIATNQLAKRQLTWLRRWQTAHWLDLTVKPKELSQWLSKFDK